MLRPSPNHGTQRLPNDDDDDGHLKRGFSSGPIRSSNVWRQCVLTTLVGKLGRRVGNVHVRACVLYAWFRHSET